MYSPRQVTVSFLPPVDAGIRIRLIQPCSEFPDIIVRA